MDMALASDSLFDKFGLWSNDLETEGISEVIEESAASAATPLPNFEDLDFNDLLEIKDEPLNEMFSPNESSESESSGPESSSQEFANDDLIDPFFNMESLMDDASLDSIKSDCMWSSVNLFNNENNSSSNSRKRRRDVSLTLSECAEGLLSINQLDVNMLDQISDAPLGASPPFMTSTFDNMEAEDNDDESEDTETNSEDEDDEIDVVGDNGGSSARTRHLISSSSLNQRSKFNKMKVSEAGRSLLKKQNPPSKTLEQINIEKQNKMNTTILDDHCYFLARPEKDIKPLKGMLTPNESSDDDEENNSRYENSMTSLVDKRKIAEAVQSLIKNNHNNHPVGGGATSNNIKFKFRMKFKSTAAAASHMKKAVDLVNQQHHDDFDTINKRERRKSASKNSFCPPPSLTNSSISAPASPSDLSNHRDARSSPLKKQQMRSQNASLLSSKNSNIIHKDDSEKGREIRDLHNSMERQRRVEQRNHLAYLKKQVPEVADMEKASKLTILRKAMDYCHLLSNMDNRIRKEKDKENSRNQMLKKRLLELSQKMESRRMTNSGRITGWSHGRY